MRKALLLSAILFGFGSHAFASEVQFDNGPPVRFGNESPTIIIRQGIKERAVKTGLTPLDRVDKPISCVSSFGCLVTAKVWVGFDGQEYSGATVSAYVDGVAMGPTPSYGTQFTTDSQQSAIVSQGTHILQSQVSAFGTAGQITGWNVEYAVYEVKNSHAS